MSASGNKYGSRGMNLIDCEIENEFLLANKSDTELSKWFMMSKQLNTAIITRYLAVKMALVTEISAFLFCCHNQVTWD